MKRLLPLSLVMVLLVPGPVRAESGAKTVRLAVALIELELKRGSVPFVGASIREIQSEDQTIAYFALFKGSCPEGSSDLMDCMISSDGYVSGKLRDNEFTIDPFLTSAHLEVTRKGITHNVAWSSSTPRVPSAFEAYCEEGDPVVATAVGFNANTSGQILGKRGTSALGMIEGITYAGTCESSVAPAIDKIFARR